VFAYSLAHIGTTVLLQIPNFLFYLFTSMAPLKPTEYELKRLENIRRNDEMMATLKVKSKLSELHTKYFSSLFLILHLLASND
jgi:hypothetical protein